MHPLILNLIDCVYMELIPTTILTGFLGAGKTTLLNRLLQENHGYRIAVIENEFGEENIDSELLVAGGAEQIIEMSNGCICCTVRGDLVEALASLAQKREAGELAFDRVVIETTGLADPGPVAQTFFLDDGVADHFMVDAIVTVIDAVHAMQQLDEHEPARSQVGFADRLLISKTDLVSSDDLAELTRRLKRINPRAPVIKADFGRVPINEVLDLRGFHMNDMLEIDPDFLSEQDAHGHEHGHGCSCGSECGHTHHHADLARHADDISAFMFSSERPFDSVLLEEFMGAMLQVYGAQMLRYKGVLQIDGVDRKIVFQGVHQLMGSDVGPIWNKGETRTSKMVFIGKNLPKEIFIRGLEQCLV